VTDKFARISAIDGYKREFIAGLNLVVIGAGAIGNEVVKNLVLFGVGNIRLYDFDKIEIHNLTRSVFFDESDVGLAKAEVVASKANLLANKNTVTPVDSDFWAHLKIAELNHFDAVICAVDNFEARIKINQLCSISKTPLFNTGIDHRYASVDIFPFKENGASSCYECNIPASVYQKVAERYSCGWIRKIHSDQKTIPTTSITASVVAAICIGQLFEQLNPDLHQNYINYQASRRVLIDTKSLTISKTNLPVKASCPSGLHYENSPVFKIHGRTQITEILGKSIDQSEWSKVLVVFSEPILLKTTKNGKTQTVIFKCAESFDENILLDNGARTLDAEIVEEMPVERLIMEFAEYAIPCNFIKIIHPKLETDLIVELSDE